MRTTHAAATVVGAAGAVWGIRHVTAPAVRAWSAGAGVQRRVGRLSVRTLDRSGSGGTTTLLLHGLTASGDSFGASYDQLADDGPLLVPDLLGFGRSMDTDITAASAFELDAHLHALGILVARLATNTPRLRIGGHSMGGVLAIHLAGRLIAAGRHVDAVVTWGAPLFHDRDAGRARIAGLGVMAGLFAFDTPLSHATCAIMCRFRRSAATLAVAVSPQLPVSIARRGVLHTWPSYAQAMDDVVLDTTWPQAVETLATARVPTRLIAGSEDAVVDPASAAWARRQAPTVNTEHVAGGTHELPLTHPTWCQSSLRRVMSNDR